MTQTTNRIMLSLFILSAITAVGAEASCNNLLVELTVEEKMMLPAGCDHGHVETATDQLVVLGNTGSYGPDCRIVFLDDDGTQISVGEFQQNYCLLSAGDITVRTISGKKLVYNIVEGSHRDGRGGKVIVTGFEN